MATSQQTHDHNRRRGLIVRRWAAYCARRAEASEEIEDLPPAVDEQLAGPASSNPWD